MTIENLKAHMLEHEDKNIIAKIKDYYKISNEIDESSIVTFTPNCITVEDKKNNITYTIEEIKDSIKVTKHFREYKIVSLYNPNMELYRHHMQFPLEEGNIFVLDEMDDNLFYKRSLSINSDDDEFLTDGSYEYETLRLKEKDITSRYEYIERNPNDINCIKVINMPNNMYFYELNKKEDTTLEATFSLTPPNYRYIGRKRKNRELIESLLQFPFASITFIKTNTKTTELIYAFHLIKIENIYYITISNKENKNINIEVHGAKLGPITEDQLSTMISLVESEKFENKEEIVEYLNYLKEIIKNHGLYLARKFDLLLNENDDFNKVSYKVYTNHESYIETIKKELKKTN